MPAGQAPPVSGLQDSRIREAVSRALQVKGLNKTSSNPDLLLNYHAGKQQQVEVDSYGYGYGLWGGGVDAYSYDEGTLIVDLVNSATQKLVWRGTVKAVLDDTPPSGQEAQDAMDSLMTQLFAKYPPKQ